MPRLQVLVIGICYLLGHVAQPTQGQDTIPAPAHFESVRGSVAELIQQRRTPAVSIAVIQENEVVWAEGFGHANLEAGVPATAHTIYRLASISKPITATGLMQLVQRGLVSLDAPANQYLHSSQLRSLWGPSQELTVRRIANHTSGLPLHYNFYYNGIKPLEMERAIERYGFAATPPGSHFEYSNFGFGVLNHIVQTVSGTAWRDYMEREVYDPLGMHHTSDRIRPGLEAQAAIQYGISVARTFYPVGHYEFDHPGASAVCSTAHDLARFALAHLNGGTLDGVRILSEEATCEMQRERVRTSRTRGVGVAWFVDRLRGRRVISHSGGMPGVSTLLQIFPDEMAAVIVLTNSPSRSVTREVSESITRILFPQPIATQPLPSAQMIQPPNPFDEHASRGTWQGTLHHHLGTIPIEITIQDANQATARLGQGPKIAISGFSLGGGFLQGEVAAWLPVQVGYHGPTRLRFKWRQRDDKLCGATTAMADGYFAISHWTSLQRSPEQPVDPSIR